jgi:hypothetical protein
MRRVLAAVGFALSLAAVWGGPAAAKDTQLTVLLDGRPLDAKSPTAIVHDGRSFIDIVRGTKAFSGLLTFAAKDRAATVSIRSHAGRFAIGSRSGTLDGQPVTWEAAPFSLNGDFFVPLSGFARVAGVGLKVDTQHHVAHLTTTNQE